MIRPEADLSIESLMIVSPGADTALLPKFNVNLKAGASIAVLGPSGSGKTSLLQKKAGFHDMILRLPEGYDTRVGPGGHHLSQGQKKGIGLSRAFYRNPVLLILDEPGTNLDSASLINFQRGLNDMKSNGSILIFATHDLRLLQLADNVLLLDNRSLKMVSVKDYMATLARAQKARLGLAEGAK